MFMSSHTHTPLTQGSYILDADGEIRLEVVEIFGQLVPMVVVCEQSLKESK